MKTKKNLITALKKLVTSFSGNAESNNAVDLVDEFADIASSAIEKELPDVSISDNGKILGVENGTWNKIDAPSGGGAEQFVFSISDNMDDSQGTCTSTKNATEIKAAITAGNIIVAKIIRFAGNNNKRYTLDGYLKQPKSGGLYVYVVDYDTIDSTPYLVLLRYSITTTVTRSVYKVALST